MGFSAIMEKSFLLRAGLIATAVLFIYWPALHGSWLWDDGELIVHNSLVHDPAGLWKIWFEPSRLLDYFPLKVSVEWLEWQFWGDDTFGYHLLNVVLHIASALLVWRLLAKFGLRLAWLGGLLFAVHPIVVESVAWIAELKNTLSLPLFLLSMCAFIDYDANGHRNDYLAALGFFIAAMLCKTTMVMFPVMILLYAWWKHGRIGIRDLKVSAPFFIISSILGAVTFWYLNHHAIHSPIPMGDVFTRVARAGLILAFYFTKCIWPIDLQPVYRQWPIDPRSFAPYLIWIVVAGFAGWSWIKRSDWGRHALLSLGFFIINLLPFLGFTAASYMRFSWVMDHLLYIPLIGLIGLATATLEHVTGQWSVTTRPFSIGSLVVIFAFLTWLSHGYARLYEGPETLWNHALRYNPDSWIACLNLGNAMQEKGETAKAMTFYERALKLRPDFAMAYYNLAHVLLTVHRLPEAVEHYQRAIQIDPNYVEAQSDLGVAYYQLHRLPEAIDQYQTALKLDPDNVETLSNLGNTLVEMGRLPDAINQLERATKLAPGNAAIHCNFGMALARANRTAEAIDQLELALKLDPRLPGVREVLDDLIKSTPPPGPTGQ